jgi:chromosome segregation ATPase
MAEDFDRRNESHDEPDNDTWAEDMFCAGIKAFGMRCPTTAPVTSAQGGALPALEDIARDLENIHGIRGKAQAMNVAGYLRERIAGRAGTKPTTPAGVALQGRTHQLEEQREALETALAAAERDLAAERAAHEAANDELIAMLGRAERAEKRAAELERERDEAQNGYDDHANLCRTLTTERDSLRAELAKVREESVGKRLLEVTVRERNEARAELAACRAKLEGLREACALSEAEASYLSTYISCDHDSPVAVIKRIQSALQATQAEKPAIAAELAACKAKLEEMRREARAFECAAQLTDEECARLEDDDGNASDVLAALQERLTFAQARLRVSSHAIHPEPASAEKPDLPPRVTQRDVDVLATMADDSVNMTAQLEDIRKRFGMMSDVDAVTVRVDELELSAQQAFERIGRLEAASAEKPSLEERVGRHEQALRHILDALGKLTTEHGDSVTTVYGDTSLADAREALDGAGNGGG